MISLTKTQYKKLLFLEKIVSLKFISILSFKKLFFLLTFLLVSLVLIYCFQFFQLIEGVWKLEKLDLRILTLENQVKKLTFQLQKEFPLEKVKKELLSNGYVPVEKISYIPIYKKYLAKNTK